MNLKYIYTYKNIKIHCSVEFIKLDTKDPTKVEDQLFTLSGYFISSPTREGGKVKAVSR